MFSCEVGLVDGRSLLTCRINLHEKSFRYYKSRRALLAFDPALRLLRWAFRRLRAHARHPAPTDAPFLPAELLRGNQRAIPAFLHQLRAQKVESFIPLRLHPPPRSPRLAHCLQELLRGALREGFRGIAGREGASQGRKGRRGADTTLPGGSNRSADSTPPPRQSRSLSVTFARLTLSFKSRPASPGQRSEQRSA